MTVSLYACCLKLIWQRFLKFSVQTCIALLIIISSTLVMIKIIIVVMMLIIVIMMNMVIMKIGFDLLVCIV